MTDQLRDDDSVAIVTFSDEAETVLPMTRLDGNRGRDPRCHRRPAAHRLHQPRRGHRAPATTTAVEGLREGATNRVVLISDALANTGDTSADAILDASTPTPRTWHHPVRRRRRQRLRRRPDGTPRRQGRRPHHLRLRRRGGPQGLLSSTSRRTSTCGPRRQGPGRLRPPDRRASSGSSATTTAQVADDDFRNDRVDGGEVGPGHTVTALYAVRTGPAPTATSPRRASAGWTRSPGPRTRLHSRSRLEAWRAPCGTPPTGASRWPRGGVLRGRAARGVDVYALRERDTVRGVAAGPASPRTTQRLTATEARAARALRQSSRGDGSDRPGSEGTGLGELLRGQRRATAGDRECSRQATSGRPLSRTPGGASAQLALSRDRVVREAEGRTFPRPGHIAQEAVRGERLRGRGP